MTSTPHDPLYDPGQDGDLDDPSTGERVAKALARAGVASRREVERLIEAGRVAINGKVLTTPAVKIGPGDFLTVDGKLVAEREPTRVFRYHKPTGLMTTHNDPKERPTVFQALPRELPRLISVGRLDLNSEGLLLLTNDGELSRKLEAPNNGWVRRYRVRAFGNTDQARLDRLKDGVTIEGVRYGSIEAKLDKAQDKVGGKNIWITISLTEGKNREIRRVLEHLDLKVNRLIRLSYGPFALATLLPGQVEEVGPRVIRELLADLVAEEDMPKGDKPQFIGIADPLHAPGTAKGGELQRRAIKSAPLPKVLEPGERTVEKPVYKAGWAKPKKKVVIAGVKPIKRAPKSIETKMIGPDPLSPRGARPSTAAKSFGAKAAGGVASARSFDKAGGKPSTSGKPARAGGFEGRSADPARTGGKPFAGKPAGTGAAKPFDRSGSKPSSAKPPRSAASEFETRSEGPARTGGKPFGKPGAKPAAGKPARSAPAAFDAKLGAPRPYKGPKKPR
ncbi:pseudouridine synthase [Caulobacter sp.]|uniref:pseudouridine synthase n=1 Tax=Caulobacter sp. TaxID=78 RepID=UPI003BABBA52